MIKRGYLVFFFFLFWGGSPVFASQEPVVIAPKKTTVPNTSPKKLEKKTIRNPSTVTQSFQKSAPLCREEQGKESYAIPYYKKIDGFFGRIVGIMASVLFWDVRQPFYGLGLDSKDPKKKLPFVVLWLFLGAVYLTFRMSFVNFRMFWHAIKVTAGKYSEPSDQGEVTHFQALSSALSATVGLGNIAGVAIAVGTGGPGATFWMLMAGLFGMTAKFTECTLGQKYRKIDANGEVSGGAMYYLSEGLKEKGKGYASLGKLLAFLFVVLCIGGSFGGGNSFQVNQSLGAVKESFPFFATYPWAYGLILTGLVGIVIFGGLKRIASTAEKIVPFMCGIYVAACLFILFKNSGKIPAAIQAIVDGAFNKNALYGGFIGVMVIGIKRAVFSNEAGVGSAAIAHSAAKTAYPVREGIVALLEPFIDTIIVCTMTALVIVITGVYSDPSCQSIIAADKGATLTSFAMGSQISWFPYVLSVAVFLFAFSTMISWSYYGERCWKWLFGGGSFIYKVLFLIFSFLGSIITAGNIKDLSDLMILGMAFPNILGLYLLSNSVRKDLDDYTAKLDAGEFKEH